MNNLQFLDEEHWEAYIPENRKSQLSRDEHSHTAPENDDIVNKNVNFRGYVQELCNEATSWTLGTRLGLTRAWGCH